MLRGEFAQRRGTYPFPIRINTRFLLMFEKRFKSQTTVTEIKATVAQTNMAVAFPPEETCSVCINI